MPIDREKVLQAAQKFVEKRRFDRAIAEYQKIIQEDPTDARILLKIGDLQARMDAHPDAIATYERVARYYAQQGFSVKAIAVYKQIREMIRKYVPKLADQYGHIIPKLAELYQQLGLTGDALATYDEYATHLQNGGRESEAIDVFRKIVELNESNPLAHLRLAEALSRDKSSEEALVEFGKAADILLEMGRRDDALKVLERLLHHRPDALRARRAAELYLERNQPNDGMMALAKLQICFQSDQRNLETLDLLARAFVIIGQATKAIEVRKEAVRIAREQGKGDVARQLLADLMAAAPNDEAVKSLAHSMLPPASQDQRSAMRYEEAQIEVSSEEAQPLPPDLDLGLDEGGAYDDFDFPPDEGATTRHAEPPPAITVDENLQAAEDINAVPQSFRAPSPVSDVLANAEAFRKLRLLSKAIETLRIALELNPSAIELHAELKDILLESGDTAGAVDEMITIAAMYGDGSEVQHAAAALNEVLQIDPYHARAREMLQEFGYELPELPMDGGMPVDDSMPRDPFPTAEGFAGYDAYVQQFGHEGGGPLPSYDLEEIGPADAMSMQGAPLVSREQFNTTDDPFASEVIGQPMVDEPFSDDPLPSFPLGEEERARLELIASEDAYAESDRVPPPQPYDGVGEETSQYDQYEQPTATGSSQPAGELSAPPLASTQAFQGGDSLEDALEEAEFFASRNLFDDALSIIDEQLGRFPNHPLLLERQREVREALAAAGGSGEHVMPQPGIPSSPPVEDHSFDIAASLSALDEYDAPQKPQGAGAFTNPVDVEEVFAKFKEGVAKQVSDTDSQSHYDLGVAYKEMGLTKDALAEFEMAARDPTKECVCQSMIGMMLMEQGNTDGAVEAFIRGLHAENKTVDQELSLYYELGNVYEIRRNAREALYYFQKVSKRDARFRDVANRIKALQPPKNAPAPSPLRTAVGEDDFDQAFDDIFGDK
ncbi:MAG: tetratricopeptide repeat protein [Deltaproteobacteria bacterium]|nr:tetratricopeptide repeat protein [Deltaproteobacteria bacterium]